MAVWLATMQDETAEPSGQTRTEKWTLVIDHRNAIGIRCLAEVHRRSLTAEVNLAIQEYVLQHMSDLNGERKELTDEDVQRMRAFAGLA